MSENKKLCLVTYIRKNEIFTKELDKIAIFFNNYMEKDFKVVICSEDDYYIENKNYEIEVFKCSGTKYKRLTSLMESDKSRYYFSIDNDISGDINKMKDFIFNVINYNYEIGWGKIYVNNVKGLISNMVAIDKLLSHNLIRPFLWKIGMGISVPGQIFCIKSDSFRGKLLKLDTFLDDLAIGLYTNVNKKRRYIVSEILGYEIANDTFRGLWKQRERWAIGYATILKGIFKQKEYRWKILVHGISYHFLWIINWILLFFITKINLFFMFFYFILIGILIVKKNIRFLGYSLVYQVIFPIFHLRWGLSLLKELLRKE